VNLRTLNPPARQTNCRNALQLAPLSGTKLLPQNCVAPPNGSASGNDFDIDNLAEQLERHDSPDGGGVSHERLARQRATDRALYAAAVWMRTSV